MKSGSHFWGHFDVETLDGLNDNSEIGSLTLQCIEAVRLKSLGDDLAAETVYRNAEADSFADIFQGHTFTTVSEATLEDWGSRLREFNIKHPIGEEDSPAVDEENYADLGDDDYAADWLEEFDSDAFGIAYEFNKVSLSDHDFRSLLGLLALCGEESINAVLFSLLRDPRMPQGLLENCLDVIDEDYGDGSMNLLYALGLSPLVATTQLLSALRFEETTAPSEYSYFGTPFHVADIYWLAAARPQTTRQLAESICVSLSLDDGWKVFAPQYPAWP